MKVCRIPGPEHSDRCRAGLAVVTTSDDDHLESDSRNPGIDLVGNGRCSAVIESDHDLLWDAGHS